MDAIERVGSRLRIGGWILDAQGPADSLRLTSEDGRAFRVDSVPRPDLASCFPGIPDAGRAGFEASITRDELGSAPDAIWSIVAERGNHQLAEISFLWPQEHSPRPLPPEALRTRVFGNGDALGYVTSGLWNAGEILAAIRRHRLSGSAPRMFEWACGVGRMTSDLARATCGAQLLASDTHVPSLHWLREHLPGVALLESTPQPPLPLANGAFDVVLAVSVFPDLGLAAQHQWRRELSRLLNPSGLLVFTTLGEHGAMLSGIPGIGERLAEHGWFEGGSDPDIANLEPSARTHASFQSEAWTRAALEPELRVLEHRPGGFNCHHDLWVVTLAQGTKYQLAPSTTTAAAR